ncbi:hypothetical protein GCM10029976_039850 [Kribbella albertanoniae]|uniref:RHS repeat-associated core domain-containing protein n=1 Tax=Kribbella albertanoniae TaxID=1266829 RepID=A0A4R4Q971_9ACTN|nr:hypothetical protein [Kribbella albertanoniae]TDC31818.1 hypothetical protein E1261_09960 [Kribbella albertanoniae]
MYSGKTALYKEAVAPANMLATWKYDKSDLLGQLAESASYTAGQAGPAYLTTIDSRNVLYNPTKVTRWIPSAEGVELKNGYYTNYGYKPDAKTPEFVSYSDGGGLGADNVSFAYTPLGLPDRMYNAAGATYVNNADYNQLGDQTLLDLGSKHDMLISNIYEDGTGRLLRSIGGKEQVFSDHVYIYDPSGNVLKDHNLVDGGDA